MLSPTELTKALRQILRKHLPDPAYKIFIYGSRAEGTNRKFSDVDVGIFGHSPLPGNIKWAIEEELEESDIPYLVEVIDFATVSEKFKKLVKLEQLKNALQSVKDILSEYAQNPGLGLRDGTIQRFEFTFELVWKTLKEHIESLGQNARHNPKDTFRVAADQELIVDPQVWFDFLTNRNLASHLYDNSAMEKVFADIPKFVAETEKIITAIEKQNSNSFPP